MLNRATNGTIPLGCDIFMNIENNTRILTGMAIRICEDTIDDIMDYDPNSPALILDGIKTRGVAWYVSPIIEGLPSCILDTYDALDWVFYTRRIDNNFWFPVYLREIQTAPGICKHEDFEVLRPINSASIVRCLTCNGFCPEEFIQDWVLEREEKSKSQ